MPYCKSCGHSIPEGTGFCPECGAPVPTAPISSGAPDLEKSPRSGGKTGIFIAVFLAAAVLIAAVIFLPRLFSPDDGPDSPDHVLDGLDTYNAQFAALHREMLEELLAPLEHLPTGSRPVSTDLTITLETDNDNLQTYLNGTYLTLRLDIQDNSMLMNGKLALMGVPILSGYLTYEDGTVGFCLPEAGGAYYTLPLSSLLSALSDTPVDSLDLSSLNGAAAALSGQDLSRLCQRYADVFLSLATEDNVTFEDNTSFSFSHLSGSATGKVYTCTPTAQDSKAMLLALADALEQDQDLRRLLASVDGIEEQLAQAVQSLRASAAQAGQAAEDSHISWKLCTAGDALLILLEDDTTRMGLEYQAQDGGTDWVFYSDSSDGSNARVEHHMTRQDGWVEGALTCTGSKSSLRLEYELNLEDEAPFLPYGTYKLFAGEGSILMYVTPDGNGNVDYCITLATELETAGYPIKMVILDILASPSSTAQAPAVPPTDISGYSDQQLQSLFQQLGDTLTSSLTLALLRVMYASW